MTKEQQSDLEPFSNNAPVSTRVSKGPAPQSGRRTLWIMLAVAAFPILLAFIVFYTGIGMPGETVNNGRLMDAALPIAPLLDESEQARIKAEPKWRLLIPVDESCKDAALEKMPSDQDSCAFQLYLTRQVFIRLGEKGRRVERLVLNVADGRADGYIEAVREQLPFARILSAKESVFRAWEADVSVQGDGRSPEIAKPSDFYYLIDPEGRAMMRYDISVSGNDLLKDLKRTLKHTPDYRS